MEIRETDLPGVGRKFTLEIAGQDEIVVVIHASGRREIFRFRRARDEPDSVIDLSNEEAHKLGSILSGGYYEPVREDAMLQIMQGLHLRWVRVGPDSPLIGRTIRDLEVRRQTGASIIAIARGSAHIPNPSPDEIFAAGDTVIVIGREPEVRAFEALMAQA
jgi:TrkA domain protein